MFKTDDFPIERVLILPNREIPEDRESNLTGADLYFERNRETVCEIAIKWKCTIESMKVFL